jgi:hypothetical protein
VCCILGQLRQGVQINLRLFSFFLPITFSFRTWNYHFNAKTEWTASGARSPRKRALRFSETCWLHAMCIYVLRFCILFYDLFVFQNSLSYYLFVFQLRFFTSTCTFMGPCLSPLLLFAPSLCKHAPGAQDEKNIMRASSGHCEKSNM